MNNNQSLVKNEFMAANKTYKANLTVPSGKALEIMSIRLEEIANQQSMTFSEILGMYIRSELQSEDLI